jgi:hypothetical protein
MQLQTLAALALYLHVRSSDAFHLQLAKFIPQCIDNSVRAAQRLIQSPAFILYFLYSKAGCQLMEKYQQEADCCLWKMCWKLVTK